MAKFSPKLGFQGIGSSDLFRFFQELKESIVMKMTDPHFSAKIWLTLELVKKGPNGTRLTRTQVSKELIHQLTLGWLAHLVSRVACDSRCELKSTGFPCQIAVTKT